MSDRTRSDTCGFTEEPPNKRSGKDNDAKPKFSNGKKNINAGANAYLMKDYNEIVEDANKASAFVNSQEFRDLFNRGATGPTNNLGNGNGPVIASRGTVRNQFNIIGGTIGQAAIGNTGSVVFNQKQNVYESGSSQSKFDISGGNFAQANIGGKAAYNNKDTNFETGGDGGAGGKMFFTAEEYTLHILERGVTLKQLQNLLELGYTLANIALALPKNPNLRNKMIDAMMVDQQMEVN